MRLKKTIRLIMLISSLLIAANSACAVVIEPSDRLKSNYTIHHRIIIFNDLSSYQDSGKSTTGDKQNFISQKYSADDYFKQETDSPQDMSNMRLTEFSTQGLDLSVNLSPGRRQTTPGGEIDANFEDIPVGSFLDSFKDEPLLQTIYFTSKDLIFGYKKKIANILQLGFDMEAKDYKNYKGEWNERPDEYELSLPQEAQRKRNKSGGPVLITESYKSILYVIIAMLGALFLCFRYILSKYI